MRLFPLVCVAGSVGVSHALDDLLIDGGPDGWTTNAWGTMVDGVMGGKSSGFVTFVEPDTMQFSGTISLDGGGFAMVRTSGSSIVSDLSDYAGVVVEFEVSEASAIPLAISVRLFDTKNRFGHQTSLALPPGSADNNVYKVGLRFDSFEEVYLWNPCSNCEIDLDGLTGMSFGVHWQEGPFEFNVLSVKASTSVLEHPDMYYELFMEESDPSNTLSCGDDIASVVASAEYAKNANRPAVGVALYSALASQFTMESSCAPEQLGLILSAQEESRAAGTSMASYTAFKAAFTAAEEWGGDTTVPAVHIPIAGGGAEWNENSWNLILDSVMGGRSTGDYSFNSDGLLFSGVVNTNGGGFVQMKKTFDAVDLSSAEGIVIEMKLLDPAVAQAPLTFGLQVSDSSNDYAVQYTAPVVVPFAPDSGTHDTYTVGVKWDAFSGRRMGFPMSGQLDTTRVQALKIDVVYVDGPFEVQFVSIAAASGILDYQDLYPSLISSHPPLEVLESKTDVVLAEATYLQEHQFDDFAVALLSSFGRQVLLADGFESTEGLKESLLSHMVASRSASSTTEAIELLQSGLGGMGGIVEIPKGVEGPDGDSEPSSSGSSQVVTLLSVAGGIGTLAAVAMFLSKRRKRDNFGRNDTNNSENGSVDSDDGLLMSNRTGAPITGGVIAIENGVAIGNFNHDHGFDQSNQVF